MHNMSNKPMNHREILTLLAPRAVVARELGRSYSTIQSWELRNCIPPYEWDGVVELARKYGRRSITERLLKETWPQRHGRKRRSHQSAPSQSSFA
jgi:hypothetical protein